MPELKSEHSNEENVASGLPLVSVIIPAYNYRDFIGETIDSVIAQTYPNVEIVVVDDGSTDDTGEVVKEYGDQIRYIYKENGGLSTARNRGIMEATGELLVFLDADDLLEPHAVETMQRTLSELSEEGYVLIASHFTAIDPEGNVIPNRPIMEGPDVETTYRDLVMRNRFSPIVLVSRDTIIECGMFDEEFGIAEQGSEDRDMWIRIASKGRVYLLAAHLTRKREHPENMSSNAKRQSASMLRTIQKAREDGIVPKWNLIFWNKVYAVKNFQTALMHRENGENRDAWKALLLSLLVWPFACPSKESGYWKWFRYRSLVHWLSLMFRKG